MINSFLNNILPKDEYKRIGFIYFLAEAAIILLLGLIVLTVRQLFFVDMTNGIEFILLGTTFFIIIYPATRYILKGMEYGDVMDASNYKAARNKGIIQSLVSGLLFGIVIFMFRGFSVEVPDLFEVFMMTFLFTIFFHGLTIFSLRKSYKQNQELGDD